MFDAPKVQQIICHRNTAGGQEQYLVQWKSTQPPTAFSWHTIQELPQSLHKVQAYLENGRSPQSSHLSLPAALPSRKRKSPGDDEASTGPRASPVSSVASSSNLQLPAYSQHSLDADADSYYGTVVSKSGIISILASHVSPRPWLGELSNRVQPIQRASIGEVQALPTLAMMARAVDWNSLTSHAESAIRNRFNENLRELDGPSVTVHNNLDGSSPSLDFAFVDDSILADGVVREPPIEGCGLISHAGETQRCNPNMGQGIGCEYTRVCDCLEYAPVWMDKLTEKQQAILDAGETLMGLPKRFPYSSPLGRDAGCLTTFYLDKRDTIYECNKLCKCGPACKTRVVQHGRKVKLQIFKTQQRGWGLRCPQELRKGQFIDTYRGEILTVKEAEKREHDAEHGKASYLFDLDKYVLDEDSETTSDDYYVVDGERVGGPTRFMNHSCEPNCGMYVVSLNKYDRKVYELAFFALKNIARNTELTFDYLDKDDDEEQKEGTIPCYCGSSICRKWLWT